MEINRNPATVLFLETQETPAGIQALFDDLCASVENLESRCFFGASTGPTGTYRACVEILAGDDPAALGLTEWNCREGHSQLSGWRTGPAIPARSRLRFSVC